MTRRWSNLRIPVVDSVSASKRVPRPMWDTGSGGLSGWFAETNRLSMFSASVPVVPIQGGKGRKHLDFDAN